MGSLVTICSRVCSARLSGGFLRAATPILSFMAIASIVLVTSCSRFDGGAREKRETQKVQETSAVSVVSTSAPTGVGDYVCSGVPSSSLKAMFGDGVEIVAASPDITNAVCFVRVNGHGVFTSKFRYVSGEYDGWNSSYAIPGDVTSTFSFEGVDGEGEAKVDGGSRPDVGTTLYTCGDRQLILAVSDGSAMRGDMKANLVSLTQSTIPWLCGSAPIPGLGKTMEKYRPSFLMSPSPSAGGTPAIS